MIDGLLQIINEKKNTLNSNYESNFSSKRENRTTVYNFLKKYEV